MKFSIGKYNFEIKKGFDTLNEAVSFVQNIYPELDKETIEKYVKTIVNVDKSRNIPKENTESGESNAKTDNGRTEKSEVRRNK